MLQGLFEQLGLVGHFIVLQHQRRLHAGLNAKAECFGYSIIRLPQLALDPEDNGSIDVGINMIRLKAYRPSYESQRIIQLALFSIDTGKIAEGIHMGWLLLKQGLQHRSGLMRLPILPEDACGIKTCTLVRRIQLQSLLGCLQCLRQRTALPQGKADALPIGGIGRIQTNRLV